MPTLPSKALSRLPSEAKDKLPSSVSTPNIVRDPDITQMNQLVGTPGQADYFVFDLSEEYPPFYQDEAISGFETGLDKIVLVNAGTGEGLETGLGWIDAVTNNMDYSFEVTGYYGFPDDPTVNDGRVIAEVHGGAQLPQYYWFNIFTVDEPVAVSDILIYSSDPFGG